MDGSHWERWHADYEDAGSPLSQRLHLVQEAVRGALDAAGSGTGPISVISMCAGQGRDVIDVLATHPHGQAGDVRALLVELDPGLVAFARQRAVEAGVDGLVTVVEGDAADARLCAGAVPADLLLACGLFGNISDDDVAGLVARFPSFCAPGGEVIWTRHRRPPDLTPAIRSWFAEAGFEEVSFEAPPDRVLSVGRHRLGGGGGGGGGSAAAFDLGAHLFDFIGDGARPA